MHMYRHTLGVGLWMLSSFCCSIAAFEEGELGTPVDLATLPPHIQQRMAAAAKTLPPRHVSLSFDRSAQAINTCGRAMLTLIVGKTACLILSPGAGGLCTLMTARGSLQGGACKGRASQGCGALKAATPARPGSIRWAGSPAYHTAAGGCQPEHIRPSQRRRS